MDNYEVICESCGNSFETNDEDAIYCTECWAKQINTDNEGKGDN